MTEALQLPVIDLSSPDRLSTAKSIRQACIDYGFFYLVNHGVEEELISQMFNESKKFFSLQLEDKMKLARKEHRGYTALCDEILDPSSTSEGDPKESFYIGPLEGTLSSMNQWPSLEILPTWRSTMEYYHQKVLSAGRRLIHLIALALNLNEDFFEKVGALDAPMAFLRLLHYPGELVSSNQEVCGASAHSDYGMITLLATDGVPGLQVCREKFNQPRLWEDVPNIKGALIVNIGDMMERWTNCLFRSTLHRVMSSGQERYSAAFFLDPNGDCVVECLESCCSESNPPKFAPIRSGDYIKERIRLTYGS
ncbi:diox n domain-containing protein-related [Citrus sinensis]|uniref:Fe2OG dioxygenase domain-containing protein n=5 Tax=Citrus sinensis TaxID=2711 RepID=A0A067FD27_CITSI|nr:diox n domain-containing protein-related [Citrus sinensis]KDO61356.1 hypothetical protein CISIN_1g021766mg [Citrus sinensis]KDO61357.1 hypothetical protein CISIN_1g021766mg [Citrus sinensis]